MSRLCTVVDDWAHNIEAARQNADAALAGVTSLDAAKGRGTEGPEREEGRKPRASWHDVGQTVL